MTSLALNPLFAILSTDIKADSGTFSELAPYGDKGIIIAMIIAYIALIVVGGSLYAISRWLDVRRYERKEIKNDSELTQLKIVENTSRESLAKTQGILADNIQDLTNLITTTTKDLQRGIHGIDVKVTCLSDGFNEIKSQVNAHEEVLGAHEAKLAVHDTQIENLNNATKAETTPAPKTRRRTKTNG